MSRESNERENLLELVCLNSTGVVGPILFRRLLDRFSSPGGILSASRGDLMEIDGIGPKSADVILKADLADAEKEIKLAESSGVEILVGDGLPPGLKAIYDPPIVLYVKGTQAVADAAAVAVVGSRRCTIYGRNQAERLGYLLAQRGLTVVSGMARGVDSTAHAGALKAGGRTIAVLGNGLSTVYPAENRKLFDRICGSGAVVSEFHMGAPPAAGNFPRRNRLISGLSLGVVVVEAAEASGSLITARLALEQGREVFAVPGKAGSPTSKGTHSLIKDGAKLVEDVDDILEELGTLKDGLVVKEEDLDTSSASEDVGETEKRFLELLSADDPLDIEDLIEKSGLASQEVSSLMVKLELKGLVECLPGKAYVRRRTL